MGRGSAPRRMSAIRPHASRPRCPHLGRTRTNAGCHFGTYSSDTQEHLPSPSGGRISPNWLFLVTLDVPGCRLPRTENPPVGGSIPPLATIQNRHLAFISRGRCAHL